MARGPCARFVRVHISTATPLVDPAKQPLYTESRVRFSRAFYIHVEYYAPSPAPALKSSPAIPTCGRSLPHRRPGCPVPADSKVSTCSRYMLLFHRCFFLRSGRLCRKYRQIPLTGVMHLRRSEHGPRVGKNLCTAHENGRRRTLVSHSTDTGVVIHTL